MAFYKVTMCDVTKIHQTMKNGPCLSTDVEVCIEPPPIPLVKLELEYERATHIIKFSMWRNSSSAAYETYNINMNTFIDVQPEELLVILKKLNITTDETGTTTP